MPEREISKHTKAIFTTAMNEHKSWRQKVGEIVLEILIIVFAISLSLLVERWRESVHNKDVEKQFLTGQKQDLQADLVQQAGDSSFYALLKNGWSYFRRVGIYDSIPNKDSINKYSSTLLSTTGFIPNDSRFEALKSSGQLGVIENDSLQELILDLYQNRIKTLQVSTDQFTHFKQEQFFPFLSEHTVFKKDGTSNFIDILHMPQMQNKLLMGNSAQEILDRYHVVMQQSRRIIAMIDEQYGLK